MGRFTEKQFREIWQHFSRKQAQESTKVPMNTTRQLEALRKGEIEEIISSTIKCAIWVEKPFKEN